MIVDNAQWKARWPNFTMDEMRCPCGCRQISMDPAFMGNLQILRSAFAGPMLVTSGYRCPEHNEAVGGTPRSLHLMGKAADVALYGEEYRRILPMIRPDVFTGLGIDQSNQDFSRRFIHLDTRDGRPKGWTY